MVFWYLDFAQCASRRRMAPTSFECFRHSSLSIRPDAAGDRSVADEGSLLVSPSPLSCAWNKRARFTPVWRHTTRPRSASCKNAGSPYSARRKQLPMTPNLRTFFCGSTPSGADSSCLRVEPKRRLGSGRAHWGALGQATADQQ
jgi:hypothetical protein